MPVRGGEVRDQRRLAGRDRHDARSARGRTPPPEAAGAGDELRRLEQLVEVVAPDDARGIERRVGHPVLAREAAAVRDGRGLRLALIGRP